jgi:hypothetical protein
MGLNACAIAATFTLQYNRPPSRRWLNDIDRAIDDQLTVAKAVPLVCPAAIGIEVWRRRSVKMRVVF